MTARKTAVCGFGLNDRPTTRLPVLCSVAAMDRAHAGHPIPVGCSKATENRNLEFELEPQF